MTEIRKVGRQDINYGPSNSTWASAGGTSLNYVPYPFAGASVDGSAIIDVRAYGAIAGDSTASVMTANVAAFTAALATGKTVIVPTGTWWVNATISTGTTQGPKLVGVNRYLSIIQFAPAEDNDVCLDFGLTSGGSTGTPSWMNYICNLTIQTSDTTFDKTAIKITDWYQSGIHDVSIKAWKSPSATNASIGIDMYGREQFYLRDVFIDADQPIIMNANPVLAGLGNTTAGVEYVNFHNLTTAAHATQSHILVNGTLSIADLSIDGCNTFSGGLNGFYSTSILNQTSFVRLENITWDAPGADGGWFVYINGNAGGTNKKVVLRNLNIYSGNYNAFNGYFVDDFNYETSTFENLGFQNSWGAATGTNYGGTLTFNPQVTDVASAAVSAGALTDWTEVDLSGIIPVGTKWIQGYIQGSTAATTTYMGANSTAGPSSGFYVGLGTGYTFYRLELQTAQTLWYKVAGGGTTTIVVTQYGYK